MPPHESHHTPFETLSAHNGAPPSTLRFRERLKRGTDQGLPRLPTASGQESSVGWGSANQNPQLCAPNPVIVSATL